MGLREALGIYFPSLPREPPWAQPGTKPHVQSRQCGLRPPG